MEYIHRMWGRAIGLTFALPASFFLFKKWVPKHVKPRLGFCRDHSIPSKERSKTLCTLCVISRL